MLKNLLTLKQADGKVERKKLSEFFLAGCSFIKDGDNMEKLYRSDFNFVLINFDCCCIKY